MTLSALIKSDSAAILTEVGQPIGIYLSGIHVRTVIGQFIEEAETISPNGVGQIVLRPMIVLTITDFADLSRSHTLRVAGNEYRPYGDPTPLKASGMVQQLLVK